MSKLRRLAGETALYGLGSIVPRFLNFLLVRLHTGVFAPDEYGVITKLYAFVAVINTLFMFGMETAYFRFASKEEAVDEKRVFNIALTIVIAISGFLSLGFILFAGDIANYMEVPGRTDLVIWLVLIMMIDAVVAIPFARLRLQKKARRFALGKLINIVVLVGMNIYFLRLMSGSPDVGLVILANLLANVFYVLLFWKSLTAWRPVFDRKLSPPILSYSYPIMLTGLAGITNVMFSRITLENWLPDNFYPGRSTKYALGVFGASYKIAVVMNLAIQAFRYAAEPFFFSNAAEKNSPHLFARVNHYFVIACCLILLGVSINLDILKYFLGQSEYWEGLHIVPVLLLAYLFLGVYYNFSVWFKLTDRTHYGTLITVGGVVVTIAANYWLIPIAGYEGSSWAALLCYSGMAAACYVLGQKYFPIPYGVARSIGYIVVTLVVVYVVEPLSFSDQWVATLFHLFVCLIFLAATYFVERRFPFRSLA